MIETIELKVDLDGVLADFMGAILERFNMNMKDHRSKVWGKISWYNDNVEPWFRSLNKMEDADVLWEFLIANFANIEILSACGTTPRDAAGQKKCWIGENLGWDVKHNIVKSGSEKAMFATPTTLLIDDREKVLNPFINAGGMGVLHTSANDTIEQLQELMKDWA